MTAICERVDSDVHPLAELASSPEFCPIEAGLLFKLADNECSHGRLPGDRTRPCGCWPQEGPVGPPPAITKEDAMELATPIAPSADSEAPFGRFKNGKPRKASPSRPTSRPTQPVVTNEDARELSRKASIRRDLEGIRGEIQEELDAVTKAIEALS